MPTGVQKATKIGAKNDPRSDFRDFWVFWAEPKFRRFWGKKKVDRKSEKILNLKPDGRPGAKNEVARRNARGHRGGDYGEGAEIFA